MANLTDADKVLRNDTGKDIVTQLTAIKTAIENGGGGSGASTVSQLTDVLLSQNIPDGDVLVRDNNLTGGKLWKNATTTIECTQAQYDALTTPQTDVNYYITDAPSMQGTSADLSYDGTTTSTYAKISDNADRIEALESGSAVSRPTIETTTGNTMMYNNSVKYGKMVSITCAIKVTAGANQYTHIATVTEKPVDIVTIPSTNNVNATYCGMINISNTDGKINIYPLSALSTNTISFTVTYYQA